MQAEFESRFDSAGEHLARPTFPKGLRHRLFLPISTAKAGVGVLLFQVNILIKMAALNTSPASLFNVEGLVAVVTGGGTGSISCSVVLHLQEHGPISIQQELG